MSTDSNDLAYPLPATYCPNGEWMGGPHYGLTKREAFAMAAMQGILASWPANQKLHADSTGAAAVEFADALIAALNEEH